MRVFRRSVGTHLDYTDSTLAITRPGYAEFSGPELSLPTWTATWLEILCNLHSVPSNLFIGSPFTVPKASRRTTTSTSRRSSSFHSFRRYNRSPTEVFYKRRNPPSCCLLTFVRRLHLVHHPTFRTTRLPARNPESVLHWRSLLQVCKLALPRYIPNLSRLVLRDEGLNFCLYRLAHRVGLWVCRACKYSSSRISGRQEVSICR